MPCPSVVIQKDKCFAGSRMYVKSLPQHRGILVRSAAVVTCLLSSSLLNGLTWALLQPGFGQDKEPEA